MQIRICMLLAEPYDPKMPARPSVIEMSGILARSEHKVTWIMPAGENAKRIQERWLDKIRLFTVPHSANSSLCGKLLARFVLAWRTARLASKIIREDKCNIIQAREDVFGGLIAVYLKKRYKIPFVFQYSFPFVDGIEEKHKSVIAWSLTKIGNDVLFYVMSQADLVLPVSEWMLEDLIRKGVPRDKMMSLPLGVNTSLFSPTIDEGENVRRIHNLSNSSVVIYTGTLDKLRHLDILIYAFAQVKQCCRRVKLLVVGQGDDRTNLENLTRNLGLEDDIVFVGQVPYCEVPRFIAVSDIGISPVPPSDLYRANSPSKLFEYMSMGKPVVANEEIYEHEDILRISGAGILVPFTPESFADAVIKLLTNPEDATKMGRLGREWVVKHRSYEILTQRLEERYVRLTRN